MLIKKQWRILTIGDGDLTFSASLASHHQPAKLTATILDSQETLLNKYTHNAYQQLLQNNVDVLCDFNVMDPTSWQGIEKNSYDVIIFQFPLIPAFKSQAEYKEKCNEVNVNTLNRQLLRTFLLNSFAHFLCPEGERLCFITSKDVKPYKEWNIENALHVNSPLHYLGWREFNIDDFPGYKIRNVDRDKHVKDTKGITYVWSDKQTHPLQVTLNPSLYQGDNFCELCCSGPYYTEADKSRHFRSKKHLNMLNYERLWKILLDKETNTAK